MKPIKWLRPISSSENSSHLVRPLIDVLSRDDGYYLNSSLDCMHTLLKYLQITPRQTPPYHTPILDIQHNQLWTPRPPVSHWISPVKEHLVKVVAGPENHSWLRIVTRLKDYAHS